MHKGVPPPPRPSPLDEERCRRRGTPNWRCPERALPGKSHCLKHYLFYVSRRHRLKTISAGETTSATAAAAAAAVEPYRPVIDFNFREPPLQIAGLGFNDQTAFVDGEMMGRFGEVDLWNGEIAPLSCGNDNLILGGQIGDGQVFDGMELRGKFEGGMNSSFNGVVNSRKRGRPKGSKTKKKGEKSEDVTTTILNVGSTFAEFGDKPQNLSWVMRDKQWSDSENDDDGFDDGRASLGENELGEGLLCNKIGGTMMMKKKRGRPKGSKNKPKNFSNGGEAYVITTIMTPSLGSAFVGFQ